MSETPAGPPPAAITTDSPGETPKRGSSGLLVQLLVIPSLIAGACLIVMVLFGALAANAGPKSPEACLRQIRDGSSRDRWEAAYGLVQLLAERDAGAPHAGLTDRQLTEKMVKIFRDLGPESVGRSEEDELTRRYLAMAMGHLGHLDAIPALREAATGHAPADAGPKVQAEHAQTRLYATWAMAKIGDPSVVPDLLALCKDADRDLRKMAVYALGAVAVPSDATAGEALRQALDDAELDVRWNAALALARRGDARAVPLVGKLLDRRYLQQVTTMTPAQRAFTLQNGVRAARGLGDPGLKAQVEQLASNDPDERVRREARDALQRWGQLGSPAAAGGGS